jgi:hypothetical protein
VTRSCRSLSSVCFGKASSSGTMPFAMPAFVVSLYYSGIIIVLTAYNLISCDHFHFIISLSPSADTVRCLAGVIPGPVSLAVGCRVSDTETASEEPGRLIASVTAVPMAPRTVSVRT